MAELKTKKNKASVSAFITTVEDEQKRKDCKELLKIFKEVTRKRATMWGTAIIGFGSYHYKSDRSSQEGDWPLTGFAPRKQNLTIYIMPGIKNYPKLLKKLGKHKASNGSCIYIKRLSDVDTEVLKEIIKVSVEEMKELHGVK